MISRCAVFCKVIEHHSFTKAAEELGYSQSSVSQTVMALEGELGATLIERRRDGVVLTPDGEQLYPYIRAVSLSEKLLEQKKRELSGLENSTISIGTFSVGVQPRHPSASAFSGGGNMPGTVILRTPAAWCAGCSALWRRSARGPDRVRL